MSPFNKDDVQTVTQSDHNSASSAAPLAQKAPAASKKRVVKTKAKKKTAVKAAPAKSTSTQAQTGPSIKLPFEKMNKIEKKIVVAAFPPDAHPKAIRPEYSIKELMKAIGVKSSLPVRNGVRRPVRGQWLEKAGRGKYRVTRTALKRGLLGTSKGA